MRLLAWGLLATTLLLLVALQLPTASTAKEIPSATRKLLSSGQLQRLASDWEPELYAELGSQGPASFMPNLPSTACIKRDNGKRRCVPGVMLIGNWQSNTKGLASCISSHPNISVVGNDRCWKAWTNDQGGRRWLKQSLPKGFDPHRHVLAALGCVTNLNFYPGFAGRFHKHWESAYWPCKAACVKEKQCEKHYFSQDGQQWPCKWKALAYHDTKVRLAPSHDFPEVNVTPPLLMRAFYGPAVKLLAVLRSPIDRLRHAFYMHPHYKRKYGDGASGFHSYSKEQLEGWFRCVQVHGNRRCAIHFEQLGPQPNDVFFHCDQVIRSIYSVFVADWLGAFPEKQLLIVRTEDLIDNRRPTLQRVWRHIGLTPLSFADETRIPPKLIKAEARLPSSYAKWTQGYGPILPETTELLNSLYKPFNRDLHDMLAADGYSCGDGANDGRPPCKAFLWEDVVA